MMTETDTDVGHTKLDLMFAPGCFLYAHMRDDEDLWQDWSADLPCEGDPPFTLYTTD